MNKDFDVKDIIVFPEKTITKEIDGAYVVLAPQYPNWIVLSDSEQKMFECLRGKRIIDAINSFHEQYSYGEEYCINTITDLLQKVEDAQFYGNAKIEEEEPIEHVIKNIQINLTSDCNMRCPHCYVSAGIVEEQRVDVEKTIRKIKEIVALQGPTEIVISGGEPLVDEELPYLLESLSGNQISLFTNGSLISEDSIELIARHCHDVQISFEGISESCYGEIRGKANYQRVLNAIQLLIERDIRIVFAITVLPQTLDDIEKNLIAFVEKLNYDNVEIRINDEVEMTGNAVSMDLSCYDRDRSKSVIAKIIQELRSKGYLAEKTRERNIRFTNCGIGASVVFHYDGFIYPCDKFSNIRVSIDEELNDIFMAFNRINKETSCVEMEPCRSCELKYICCGGCRIDNYCVNGDMKIPICDTEYKNMQYRKLVEDNLMYYGEQRASED